MTFNLHPSNEEVDKAGKTLLKPVLAYVKEVVLKECVQQRYKANEEHNLSVTTKALPEEKKMGHCHSHSVSSGCVAENVAEKLVIVDETKRARDMLDNMKNDVLMNLAQQVKKMAHDRKEIKTAKTIGI